MFKGKKLTRLDDPKGTFTNCNNINYKGAIVGDYRDSSNQSVGFLYKNGKFTDVPGPAGALPSQALGINDRGEIVGSYGLTPTGFLLKGKTYTILKVPGAQWTFASGINNHSNIVLFWNNGDGSPVQSSFYDGKTYKTIDVPGADNSAADDLANSGDVSYEWWDINFNYHGALLHRGKYYKFDFPKSVQTFGWGINDDHVLVGGYEATTNGPVRGYKATYK